jgi:uncharacterized protein YlxW (UPF0749 family)
MEGEMIEFKDKEVQNKYDDLQAEAMDLANQLEDVEQKIKAIEDSEERE